MFGALSFTSPLILAALAGLPLIWWLLRASPPSPRAQDFPAFVILRDLVNKRETPQRMPWPLLLLRLLLGALIIAALAGPILNAPPRTPATGPLALVLDDTFTAAQHWRVRRDALLTAAAEAEQAERPLFLVTTAPQMTAGAVGPVDPATPEAIRNAAASLSPSALRADRASARAVIEATPALEGAEIRWLSDGLASASPEADAAFARTLGAIGALTVFNDRDAPKPVLRPDADGNNSGSGEEGSDRGSDLAYVVERLRPKGDWDGVLVANAEDGRELARTALTIADGERRARAVIDLPLALRNEAASVRLESVSSAGAVQLIDARDRRALIGLIAQPAAAGDRLLSGGYYLREALGPHAAFVEDSLGGVLEAGVSVIMLDDIGSIRPSEVNALTDWIEKGGVLIRFAGPILAEAAQDNDPPLLPVSLRGGGRAFGGALTWETPQRLDAFPAESPFAGLDPPEDVLIKRQVLAQPGGETTARSWARLQDGTPLVTGLAMGDGAIALFHVTATPNWSDLPISGIFVDMLRRLVFLSALGPTAEEIGAETRYAPLRLLNGAGRFVAPGEDVPALTAQALALGPAADRLPGLYGSPEAPLALNVMDEAAPLEPLSLAGVAIAPYETAPPRRLAPPLTAIALALLLIDALATLMVAGKLPLPRLPSRGSAGGAASAMIAALVISGVMSAGPSPAAQPLDAPIDPAAADAALETRLAYVKTGDPALDRLSAQAMAGLSRELTRRTALEPGAPAGIDPETDDLSVYPFLYWPMAPGAEAPSEAALANIENFMRFGGLIVFDTRDDERAIGPGSTPEAQALQRLLSQLNIPPLAPVAREHVLTRSFYLLPDLFGRQRNNPVWVAAEGGGANDGVTPVIIGGRDWAGAWATDSFGRPLRSMGQGGERARELAYRAGVNIVMVAFTGNYKSDQVHTPILLERLGRQ